MFGFRSEDLRIFLVFELKDFEFKACFDFGSLEDKLFNFNLKRTIGVVFSGVSRLSQHDAEATAG